MKDVSDENVHEPQSSQQMQATDEASDKIRSKQNIKRKRMKNNQNDNLMTLGSILRYSARCSFAL